jgi:hypothetical protein
MVEDKNPEAVAQPWADEPVATSLGHEELANQQDPEAAVEVEVEDEASVERIEKVYR